MAQKSSTSYSGSLDFITSSDLDPIIEALVAVLCNFQPSQLNHWYSATDIWSEVPKRKNFSISTSLSRTNPSKS